jgi:23S rRNA pseudouridine2605 synthase
MSQHAPDKVRLQKFLAEAGVAARRAAEDLVLEGRVTINGHLVDGLPAFVDPGHDDVRVDGQRVRPVPRVYYLLNKPKGTVVSNSDPSGRERVGDLLEDVKVRVFPVGRLEVDADGVLLMTNDGELVERLTHPRYGVEKVFRVEVRGQVSREDLASLRKGMWLSEGRTSAARVHVTFTSREMTVMEVAMRAGRHRQIPRMLARLGYKVRKLTCVRIGRLTTRGLSTGAYRPLKEDEVKHLYHLVADRAAAAAQAAATLPAKAARASTAGPSRPQRPAHPSRRRSRK